MSEGPGVNRAVSEPKKRAWPLRGERVGPWRRVCCLSTDAPGERELTPPRTEGETEASTAGCFALAVSGAVSSAGLQGTPGLSFPICYLRRRDCRTRSPGVKPLKTNKS